MSAPDLCATAERMSDRLIHRGPDDAGSWAEPAAGLALGHRRLSILDLSPEGHQPMFSADGQLVTIYNGEIYNFAELRRTLESEGQSFRGHSDTEVLLAGFSRWGFEETLEKCVGMFAIALWDRRNRALSLARDRMGEKPLYYGWQNGVFMFASELKALRAHPAWNGEVDRNSTALMMRYGYVPAPYSIYRGIWKLPPATVLCLEFDKLQPGETPPAREYWSARQSAIDGDANPFRGGDGEAVGTLERVLRQSVRQQMVADVPLGAFLSGGIDSSTIVALMQAESTRPVKTFSIGFHESRFNEAPYAKAIARHLGTDHTELYVTPEEAMTVIPSLPRLYDEPFSDSSQIPTYLVAKLARKHVTVSLSGDGGDELFDGYPRYDAANLAWSRMAWTPRLLQAGLGVVISNAPSELLNAAVKLYDPSADRRRRSSSEWKRLAGMLRFRSGEELYRGFLSHWQQPSALVKGGSEPADVFTDHSRWAKLSDFRRRMMFLDQVSYLPDDILVKVDRAAMAVSLETRAPLLDHRVVDFAWRLPTALKRRGSDSKWILKQVLYRHVPKALIDRPKMGFGVPIESWLRGPLREWAESLLAESRLRREGYLDSGLIRKTWDEHLGGKIDQQPLLWNVLMFESWLEATSAPDSRPQPAAAAS